MIEARLGLYGAAVGSLVQWCLKKRKRPADLTVRELRQFSPRFADAALELLSADTSVRLKDLPGGTAPSRVRAALKAARKRNA